MPQQHDAQRIGMLGERHVKKYLQRKGWRIVAKNIRFGNDELDILSLTPDEQTLMIIEVRSTAQRNKLPERTVGSSKRAALLRMAKLLRGRAKQYGCCVRVDLITVCFLETNPKIKHFKSILAIQKSRTFS